MARKSPKRTCCDARKTPRRCCTVEALVQVDHRGQMVLPKEIRERAGISAGDKLAVVIWEKAGNVCCIGLVKAGEIGEMVRDHLGPVIREIFE